MKRTSWSLLPLMLSGVVFLLGCGAGGAPSNAGVITALSNRADLISVGDALVEFTPADGVDAASAVASLGPTDFRSAFAMRPIGRHIGMVHSLAVGSNVLVVKASTGQVSSITIRNHPIGGPTFTVHK